MSREERKPIVSSSSSSTCSSGDDEVHPVVRRRSTRDTELAGHQKDAGCCDPTSTPHRFLALLFMCLLGFGKNVNSFATTLGTIPT